MDTDKMSAPYGFKIQPDQLITTQKPVIVIIDKGENKPRCLMLRTQVTAVFWYSDREGYVCFEIEELRNVNAGIEELRNGNSELAALVVGALESVLQKQKDI